MTLDRDGEAVALVRRIVDSQRARGPDCQDVARIEVPCGEVVLGHDRLSIIDLSAGANQPMFDHEGGNAIAFNGEIYNYVELRSELEALGCRFRTRSDTEVLLQAHATWGLGTLDRLRGMFAYALYDARERSVLLVRDRFGVKPLCFHEGPRRVMFASTGRVIAMEAGLPPDLSYVARGVRQWYYDDDSDATQYEGLRAVPAGCFVRIAFEDGAIRTTTQRWYDFAAKVDATRAAIAGRAEEDLLSEVRERIEAAVAIRLRSDVPVGVSLSGGLDSSTVAALVARRHREPVGFSFGSPGAQRSEGPLVDELARRTGFRVEWVWPEPAAIGRAFGEVLDAQDAPFNTGSVIAQFLVFRAARQAGVKVLLGGQGGDELFMGYRKFLLFRLRSLVNERRWADAAVFAVGLIPTILASLSKARLYWSSRARHTSGAGLETRIRLPAAPVPVPAAGSGRALDERQVQDILRYSLPTLLRYEDRNSMGNSVESRLPFLDHDLAELAAAIPAGLKLRHGHGKWAVRRITAGLVPDSIRLSRHKRGFDVDQAAWMAGGLGEAIRERILSGLPRIRDLLAPGVRVEEEYSDFRLAADLTTFNEAVALAWLAGRR